MKTLVTGSSGLIGSAAVRFFSARGHEVHGLDNNTRMDLFGAGGDTRPVLAVLRAACPRFVHHELDIRDRAGVPALFERERFSRVIHCAAQPSHDLAASRPLDDFDINAGGTINLLEAARRFCPESPFVHVSTNKVYGDGPNGLDLVEGALRYDFSDERYAEGIGEDFPIDQNLHSLFGASKASGDLIAQEYGRYFSMPVGVFRGGCLTGPDHAGVKLHGFLSYLVRTALAGETYTIIGYGGKQVRDQIHCDDVIEAFDRWCGDPRPGEVFNIGGGRANSASVLECVRLVEEVAGVKMDLAFDGHARRGDHICYYSDLSRLRGRLAGWDVTRGLVSIVEEMVDAGRQARAA
ncbi:MAG: NAD-dependent epimerase/dehydratase family protein [Planctomycetota bacterium]